MAIAGRVDIVSPRYKAMDDGRWFLSVVVGHIGGLNVSLGYLQ